MEDTNTSMLDVNLDLHDLPPGLHPGGSWIPVIQNEIRSALASQAFVQVLKPPPMFVRWLLNEWLRFPSR